MVRQGGSDEIVSEIEDDEVLDWTILKSILAANDETTQALQSYLLQTVYDESNETETESTEQYLSRAIDRHQRIIEDLRLAQDLLEKR